MSNTNIIFYSKKCNNCKKLFDMIINFNELDKYKTICIDNNHKKFPYIHRVPTLITENIKKPLIGINAFRWIESQSQFNKETNNYKNNPNQFLNEDSNPLLYEDNNKIRSNLNHHNNAFVDTDNIDKNFTKAFKSDKIDTFPEVKKLNLENQKNKMDSLLNLRLRQDNIFNSNDLGEDMSTIHNELLTQKSNMIITEKSKMNSKLNNRFFNIKNQKNDSYEKRFIGQNTSKKVINKKKYNI